MLTFDTKTKTLTIGELQDFNCKPNPKYKSARNVIIDKKLSKIPSHAFDFDSSYPYLTTVKGDGINTVGEFAFSDCVNLKTIDLPALNKIEDNAFFNTALEKIDFPIVSSIGECAFGDCNKLSSVNLPNLETLGSNAFQRCKELKVVNMPLLEVCNPLTFWKCHQLSTVSIPNLTCIKYRAFSKSGLENATFDKLETIEYEAFSECKNLRAIELPRVTSLGVHAFFKCINLKHLTLTRLKKFTDNYGEEITSCGGSIDYISPFEQSGLKSISLITIHQISIPIFRGCDNLKNVFLPGLENISCCGFFEGLTKLKEVKLPILVSVPENSFKGCTNLETISLPRAQFIKSYAFSGCTSLEKVDAPNVLGIYPYAFKNCAKLKEVTRKTCADEGAFEGCPKMLPKGDTDKSTVLAIDSQKELDAKKWRDDEKSKYTKIIFGEDVISIPEGCFVGFNNLKSVEGENVETVEKSAFSQCSGLESVDFENAVFIKEKSFFNCKNLINVAGKPIKIENEAFSNCNELATINLSKASEVGEKSFENCKTLEYISLSHVAKIGDSAFKNCSGLKKVTFPMKRSFSVGVEAFMDCRSLLSANLSNATKVGDKAFNCTGISRFSTGKCVIGEEAFSNCLNLFSCDCYATNIGKKAFSGCKKLNDIILAKATTIEEGTFEGCSSLSSITANKVKCIKANAFNGCLRVKRAQFSRTLQLDEKAFGNTNICRIIGL